MTIKIISLLSSFAGSGQITIAVNLAAGFARKGFKVLVYDTNQNKKLYKWLNIKKNNEKLGDLPIEVKPFNPILYSSFMGIDVLSLEINSYSENFWPSGLSAYIKSLFYDYIIINTANRMQDLLISVELADSTVVCTDLSHDNELSRIIELKNKIQELSNSEKTIDFFQPSKIETKEWDNNSNKLFAIGDYFGYEKLGDLIPT